MATSEQMAQAEKWKYPCWKCGVVGTGGCPNDGSSDCPLTMHEDKPCDYTIDDLRYVLSFR